MICWKQILELYAERPLFIARGTVITYREFHEFAGQFRIADRSSPLTALDMDWEIEAFARLLGALDGGTSVILDKSVPHCDLEKFPDDEPLLVLRSGGTTGKTRHVVHSWKSFLTPFQVKQKSPQRWMILYAASHIAGLDAFLHALHRGVSIVIPGDNTAATIGDAIDHQNIDVIAATPTGLQMLIFGGLNESHDLSRVTWILHGAERMSPASRKKIQEIFPIATLKNRFGLTETGALPVRTDPEDPQALYLDAPGYAWKLVDGELYIKSPAACLGTLEYGRWKTDSKWQATGDLAVLTGRGSFKLLGRRESIINIGGEKIHAEEVEHLLLEIPGVRDALAYPVANQMSGQVAAADVVLSTGLTLSQVRRKLINKVSRSGGSLATVPVKLNSVERIPRSASGKRIRPTEWLDLQ